MESKSSYIPPPQKITIKPLKRKRGRPRKQKVDIIAAGGDVDAPGGGIEGYQLNSTDREVRYDAKRKLNLVAHMANVKKQLSSQDFIDQTILNRVYNFSHVNREATMQNPTKIIFNNAESRKATSALFKALGMGFQPVKKGGQDSTTGRRIAHRTGLIPANTLKWFHPGGVHPVEERSLPEWFTSRTATLRNLSSSLNSMDQETYIKVRNILIAVGLGASSDMESQVDHTRRITLSSVTGSNSSFSPSVMQRLFDFLERWGLLNTSYNAKSEWHSIKSIDNNALPPKSSENLDVDSMGQSTVVETCYRPRSIEDVKISEEATGIDGACSYIGASNLRFLSNGTAFHYDDSLEQSRMKRRRTIRLTAKEYANGEYPVQFSHKDFVKEQKVKYSTASKAVDDKSDISNNCSSVSIKSITNAENILERLGKERQKRGHISQSCLTLSGLTRTANKKHREHSLWDPLVSLVRNRQKGDTEMLPLPSRLSILSSRYDAEELIDEPWGTRETLSLLEAIESQGPSQTNLASVQQPKIDWTAVAKFVSDRNCNITRTPDQCMIHFTRLPMLDKFRNEARLFLFHSNGENGLHVPFLRLQNPLNSFLNFVLHQIDPAVAQKLGKTLLDDLHGSMKTSTGDIDEKGMENLCLDLLRKAGKQIEKIAQSELSKIYSASIQAALLATEAHVNRLNIKLDMIDLLEQATAQRVKESVDESSQLYLERRQRMYATIKNYRKELLEAQEKDISLMSRAEKYRILQRLKNTN
eukprot:g961.t1